VVAVSYFRYVGRRLAFAVGSVYAVVTAAFVLSNATAQLQVDSRVAAADPYNRLSSAEREQLRERFRGQYGLDEPVLERYVDWLVDVTAFDWGRSLTYGEPVLEVLDGRVVTTVEYVLPGVALALVVGVLGGLVAALDRGPLDWLARLGSYVLLGTPAFVFVVVVAFLERGSMGILGPRAVEPATDPQTLAALAVAASLLAGQVRFSRASSLDQTTKPFVKALRARGAGPVTTARHVLRNAAVPIVSLSLGEVLAVLVLDIYVLEDVLGIDGLATASLRAIQETDVSLVIGTTMVVAFVGVAGNLLQDLLYGYLDPQIGGD
jgi:peptide/nickel transport system permease protein